MQRTHDHDVVADLADVSKRFGSREVLRGLSLRLERGKLQALLGANGAGKTTTLRLLAGLVSPSGGTARVLGSDSWRRRASVGLVPSGDRSFYLRLTGRENLLFFGRLQGLSKRAAAARADELLEQVGLADAARVRVGFYSHGMQKRLSAARALIVEPALLLVDEATHDLDPDGARRVRELVSGIAARGTAVVWATQRLEEIRGFAEEVLVLHEGSVAFSGSVPSLVSLTLPRRFVLRLRNGGAAAPIMADSLDRLLGEGAKLRAAGGDDAETYVLDLLDADSLGDALRRLLEADVDLLACRDETPPVESAFLSITRGASA